jgi:hypothetical protein
MNGFNRFPGPGRRVLRENHWRGGVAEIVGARYSATGLMAAVCERLTEVMPIEFEAEGPAHDLEAGAVRFAVHTLTQSANVVDWVGMHTVGAGMQAENWRTVGRRVVALSGAELFAGTEKNAPRQKLPRVFGIFPRSPRRGKGGRVKSFKGLTARA